MHPCARAHRPTTCARGSSRHKGVDCQVSGLQTYGRSKAKSLNRRFVSANPPNVSVSPLLTYLLDKSWHWFPLSHTREILSNILWLTELSTNSLQAFQSNLHALLWPTFGSILTTPLHETLLQPGGSTASPPRSTDLEQVPSSFRTSGSPADCRGSPKPFPKNTQFSDLRK